ncbi:MAG: DUF3365 domain-containing protein [Flavobacteriales bacterium]|jgi:cytochrome c553|nr:DUF3365 domain-containing protein [Flavobacteriales bacterium]
MRKYLYSISSILLLSSCGAEPNEQITNVKQEEHPGKELMALNCNACHSPTAGENARIAPPMIAVKKHYLQEGMAKEDFQTAILKWINNPVEEHSKMPGAIKKFGIMAKVDYPKETILHIADYLYSHEIEKPEWFDEHYKKHHDGDKEGKEQQPLTYAEIGMKYAFSTKSQLGKNLMGAIQSKGTEGAVSFCNTRAISITDSMAIVNNATIKRVSDKARNPNNKANTKELAHIVSFKKMLANQEEFKPIVEENGEKVNFYFPIKTNAMCLQCHGEQGQDLKHSTYNRIKSLYPNDEAIGYEANQIRGIWSIQFDK